MDGLCHVLSDRGLNRNVLGRSTEPVGGSMRLLKLSVALGLPTSDGCGKVRWAPRSVFGENRNVRPEDELERPELMPGEKLRVFGVLGLKFRVGAQLLEGLGELKDGRGESAWNDRPEPNEGRLEDPEDIDGAERGWLNEGLGRLDPTDPPDRPALVEGLEFLENDLCCMLDIRLDAEVRLDLSLPISLSPAMGEISTAAITVTIPARDLIFLLISIIALLPSASI